jgi:hypothetical protein
MLVASLPGKPFLLSAALSAPLAFAALALCDGPRGEARPVAYLDARVDVAHEGSALETSLRFALQWLQRHQHPDGRWSARSFRQLCEGRACAGGGADEHDLGVTALATLAILESGGLRPRFEDAARKGIAWLLEQQGLDGCFGPSSGKFIYGHALATLALARADDEALRPHLARGLRFLRQARNPGYAWRYGPRDGDNDTSVTFWAGSALLAGSGTLEPHVAEGLRRSLAQATSDWTHETAYRREGAVQTGSRFEKSEGPTAMALALRLGLGGDRRELRGAARRLGWSLPCWNPGGSSVDFVAWFAGTRALAAYGDAELWEPWSASLRRTLVGRQRKYADGCACGSWEASDPWSGEGGRVYATAINAWTLAQLRAGMRTADSRPSAVSTAVPRR